MVSPWQILEPNCAGAKKVIIAAPYIKAGMLKILLDHLKSATEIECFTRWTPQDILAGVTDTACRTMITDVGGKFYLHKRLHAKYYRLDNKVFTGSANATATGMNYGIAGNLEILSEPGQSFDQDLFERELRAGATEVSDQEFGFWLACPTNSPSGEPDYENLITRSIEDWRPLTRFPEYLWIIYSGEANVPLPEEQRARAQLDLATLQPPANISEEKFKHWVQACLKATPFIESVIEVKEKPPDEAWQLLATEWEMDTTTAERARTTAQRWLAHFQVAP